MLDAARRLIVERGLEATRMEDVAQASGVARVTLYRRFGSRSGLVEALLAREVRTFLAALDAAVEPLDDVAERTVEGFVWSLRLARAHPLLGHLLESDPASLLPHLTTEGEGPIGLAREFLARRLRAGQRAGEVPPFDAREVAELVVRVALSFVLTPEGAFDLEDPDAARAFARRYLVPLLTTGTG